MLFLASEQLNDSSIVSKEEPDTMKGHNFIDNIKINELDSKHKEWR